MISCAKLVISIARLKASVAKLPSGRRYLRRFSDARLQAELSRNIYSEQGLEALIRAVFEQVCQALIVVSNCRPGSPHSQVACAMVRQSSRAL